MIKREPSPHFTSRVGAASRSVIRSAIVRLQGTDACDTQTVDGSYGIFL